MMISLPKITYVIDPIPKSTVFSIAQLKNITIDFARLLRSFTEWFSVWGQPRAARRLITVFCCPTGEPAPD
jgi:hypothetical protein